jgi:hypothetical protein
MASNTYLTKVHNYYKLVTKDSISETDNTEPGIFYVYPAENGYSKVKYGTGNETLANAPVIGGAGGGGDDIIDENGNAWLTRFGPSGLSGEYNLIFGDSNNPGFDGPSSYHSQLLGKNNATYGQYNFVAGCENTISQPGGLVDDDYIWVNGDLRIHKYQDIGVTGIFNTAIGYNNSLEGAYGLAIGRNNTIRSSEHGITIGKYCEVYKDPTFTYMNPNFPDQESPSIANAIAGGWQSKATRNESVAWGQVCQSHGSQGLAFGHCAVVGHGAEGALSFGCHTVANTTGQVVLGVANKLDSDKLLIVGNGTFTDVSGSVDGNGGDNIGLEPDEAAYYNNFRVTRSNAFSVDKYGNGAFAGGISFGPDGDVTTFTLEDIKKLKALCEGAITTDIIDVSVNGQ